MAKHKSKVEDQECTPEDYFSCFSTPAGKRVLDDLKKCYSERCSFDKNPYQTAFYEGERSVYLKILFLMDEVKNPKKRQEEGGE